MKDHTMRVPSAPLPALLFIPVLAIALLAPVASAQTDDQECFRIKDPLKLKGLVDIDTARFGLDPACKISNAKLFCTPGSKTVTEARHRKTPITVNDFWSPNTPGSRICYDVTCPKETLPDQQVTDKFGTRILENLKAKMVCTPAVPGPTLGADQFAGFPATGQKTCWTGGHWDGHASVSPIEVPCAGTGQDGETQAGATLQFRDNGDGTVTDLNTALMWEKKSSDGGIHDYRAAYPWSGFDQGLTAPQWADQLNVWKFAGYDDWRLPNIRELLSIIDFGKGSPMVAAEFHDECTEGCTVLTCSCTASENGAEYWSSTQELQYPDGTYSVSYGPDTVIDDPYELSKLHVRAVRGGL